MKGVNMGAEKGTGKALMGFQEWLTGNGEITYMSVFAWNGRDIESIESFSQDVAEGVELIVASSNLILAFTIISYHEVLIVITSQRLLRITDAEILRELVGLYRLEHPKVLI